jgi:hypothetical protein
MPELLAYAAGGLLYNLSVRTHTHTHTPPVSDDVALIVTVTDGSATPTMIIHYVIGAATLSTRPLRLTSASSCRTASTI